MNIQHLACVVIAASLTACGGGGGGSGGGVVPAACSVGAEKSFVRDATYEWYLFPELLPAQVNTSQFADAQELLDYMTAAARVQGKDRYFSYVTTKGADSSFLQEGQFIGFGFRIRVDGNRVYFMEAFENSPASAAGITRGAELLAVDSGAGFVGVANLLPTDPNLSEAFGPATEGVVRGLRFAKPSETPTEASLTKRVVTIQPIPGDGVQVLALALPGNASIEVGYVNLRSYISTAETPLRGAFRQFAERGIQNVIVDLRYNGGGLISVANLMGDLMGALRQPTDVYNNIRFRPSKSSADETRYFRPISGTSVDAVNIAFITTGASASASELTVNAMKPWANVAIVGTDTYGKPVGQSAFDLSSQCDIRLRLVTLRSTNADEEGDYYNGLASTLPGRFCSASDDLARAMSDPDESSTAEALHWLGNGACSPAVAGIQEAQKPGIGIETRYPMPEHPTPAQVNLPGLY
jgi:C-terminal processing protease CtpA/Prc